MSNENKSEASEISELNKTILIGRIYPAIQSCVGNRYKIIAGYFAIVGFLAIKSEILKKFIDTHALLFLSMIFSFFVFHNFCNYWSNAKEQCGIEDLKNNFPKMEAIFGLIMLTIIWGGFCLLKSI